MQGIFGKGLAFPEGGFSSSVIPGKECGRDYWSGAPVVGELLADRLERGPMPPEEALRCAIALGNTLHRAHSSGRIHGALSPWTIALTSSGVDLLEPLPDSDPRGAAYRSPEQVRGLPADLLSDVFSYGAVLYELAGGKPAFLGKGSELEQAILERPPAALLSKSPVSAGMEGVIAGCLEKDPAHRRQRIKNAVLELRLASRPRVRVLTAPFRQREHVRPQTPWDARPAQPVTNGLRRRFLIGGLLLLGLAALAVAAVLTLGHHNVEPDVLKFPVATPENASYPGTPAISPDGRFLAFSAVGPEGKRMLWVKASDEMHAHMVPGTEGGFAPFWSPDSQAVAYFAAEHVVTWKLTRDENGVPGGSPQVLCAAGAQAGGGTWNKDGVILFASDLSSGLSRVSAAGGKPQAALGLDRSNGFVSYRWPQFLPDGKHFIFYGMTDSGETSGVYSGALDSTQVRRLFASQTNSVYSAEAGSPSPKSGYLLYIQDRIIMAQPFNPATLQTEGDAIQFVSDVWPIESLTLAPIAVSSNAVLVYQSVGRPIRQLVWLDRSGKQIRKAADPGDWGPPRISPDGKRVVVGKGNSDTVHPQTDLWILDDDGARQLPSEPGIAAGSPVWSPDGNRVTFWCGPSREIHDICVQSVNATAKRELLFRSDAAKNPTDWSSDGRYLLFGAGRSQFDSADIWAMTLSERRAAPVVATIHNENYAVLSPDGRWLAYQSDESGQNQIYIQPFEGLSGGTKRRWQISQDGGALPRWRADGRELFYLTGDGLLMSVNIHPQQGELAYDAPRVLFETHPLPSMSNLYDASPDGQRFLLNLPMEWTSSAPITVVTNWTKELKR